MMALSMRVLILVILWMILYLCMCYFGLYGVLSYVLALMILKLTYIEQVIASRIK